MSDPGPKLYISLQKLLEKSGEGPTHKRLRLKLDQFARKRGFTAALKLKGVKPDVSRKQVDGHATYWLLGDAKDSANETPGNTATATRVARYVSLFANMIIAGHIDGGRVAIATDTPEAAREWRRWLNRQMGKHGIVAKLDETPPSFTISELDDETFIVWW